MRLTRRATLAGLAAALALPAAAPALEGPRARPRGGAESAAPEALSAILERSGLGAISGLAVADAATGERIEAHLADLDRPPASVAKIVTALYALDRLGPAHRFATRLVATAPVAAGTLGGDLVLAGGGDPLLDTDALGDLAAAARDGGLARVEGRLVVAEGALPGLPEIDAGQPAQAGYNPAVSGMNLNFNRVFLEWAPGAKGPELRLTAPGLRYRAKAASIAAEVAAGGPPAHRFEGGREVWALPARWLKGAGGVWLPVRAPGVYAGEALRALARERGLALPPPLPMGAAPDGVTLARRDSVDLVQMMRAMLRYSTNLTAEAAGLAATKAGGGAPADLAASAGAMSDWARARYGLTRAALVNHSGLTGRSGLTAGEMVRLLLEAQAEGLPGMLRERGLRDGDGDALDLPGVRVVAKTGTLDFVSSLAGYVEGPGTRRLAFAIFAADPAARDRIAPEEREDPPGAAAFARRARAQEQALLRRWIALGSA